MDASLESVVTRNGGFFTRAQALDCGWLDRDLLAARRAGVIVRLRQGAYSPAEINSRLDDSGRHIVLAKAVLQQQRGAVALTGVSAAALHGLALWGHDLSVVHVVRLDDGASRHETGVKHHRVRDQVADCVEVVDGVRVIGVARTVWEVASMSRLESGVCVADSAIRQYPLVGEQLRQFNAQFAHRPGTRSARMALRLANPRSESAGESISRVWFFLGGIPAPQLQVPIYDRDGQLIGRSDFCWPEYRHLGEFDGKIKYGALLRPGEDATDALFREKRREDALRAELYGMSRWTWADLMPAGRLTFIQRLHFDLNRSAQLYGTRTARTA